MIRKPSMARSLLSGRPMKTLLAIRRRRRPPPPVVPPPREPYVAPPRVPDAALHALQRLRYDVYCLEQRFVDAARCTDGRESDESAPPAIHFAAATETGEVVATLRLVLDSPLGFPLERYAAGLLDHRPALARPRTRAA